MDNIKSYKDSLEEFDKTHREPMEKELKELLSQLKVGETIPLNSNNCDGTGIAVLNYSDAINIVGRHGDTIIYNNFECDGSNGCIAHDDEDTNVFGMPLEVTVEILKCVREYIKNKLPYCVKIKDTVFLVGEERSVGEHEIGPSSVVELFDMTTEMKSGDSYSIFVDRGAISYMRKAHPSECEEVIKFFTKQ